MKFPKDHMVKAINPISPGDQLLSFKRRPNDPCQCESGKKAKKCCGTATRFLSTDKLEVRLKEKLAKEAKNNG
jgi:hypothetical protein